MIKACGKNIIVKEIVKEEKKTVLIVPNDKGPKFYEIVDCQDGKQFKKGDKIYLAKYTTSEMLEIENEKYFIISEDSVLAIVP